MEKRKNRMTKTVSTRLNDEEVELLNKIAEEENIDRSSLIRKFVLDKMKFYKIQQMAKYYQQGVVSLQEAATQAKVTIYEMMAYLQKENIHPPPQEEQEIRDEIAKGHELMRKV
jgi:predicted HTH domain antitoxin